MDAIDCDTLEELDNMTRAWSSDAQVVTMAIQMYENRYGDKVENFNGKRKMSPAKLGMFEWFVSSGFDKCWHIEDDCLVPDVAALVAQLPSPLSQSATTFDLLIKAHTAKPFWFKDMYRVGNASHGLPDGQFCFATPSLFCMSKRFARSLMETIHDENTSSHHEIFLPYIVHKYGLSWANLTESVAREILSNGGQRTESFLKLDQVLRNVSASPPILASHPIKEIGDLCGQTSHGASARHTVRLELVLPNRAAAGDRLTFSTAAGRFSLMVPRGAVEGKKLIVTMPVPASFPPGQQLTASGMRINDRLLAPAPSTPIPTSHPSNHSSPSSFGTKSAFPGRAELLSDYDASASSISGELRSRALPELRDWLDGPLLGSRPPLPPLLASDTATRNIAIAASLAAVTCDPKWLPPLHPEHGVAIAHDDPAAEN